MNEEILKELKKIREELELQTKIILEFAERVENINKVHRENYILKNIDGRPVTWQELLDEKLQ